MSQGQHQLDRRQRRLISVIEVVLLLGLAGLVGRLVYINTELSPKLHSLMESQHEGWTELPARRGSIFDCRGRLLAGSRRHYGVFADPGLIEAYDETARRIAPMLGMEPGQVEDLIRQSGNRRYCLLKDMVDESAANAIREANIPGIGLADLWVRHYPMGSLMAHVLGFAGRDGVGLEGIEALVNDHLSGKPGRVRTIRDAGRRMIRLGGPDDSGAVDPVDGGHVVLTLDSVIQGYVEQALADQVAHFQAKFAMSVVMDPQTGDILAMACHPTFDPNEFQQFDPEHWRNKTVTDLFEPGSTFKPFVATGALLAGVVSPGERINCHDGLYMIGSRALHDSSPHGVMTFEEIIWKSSNIGMAIIGMRMGNKRLHEIVTRFGFGSPTGVDLPGERVGGVNPLAMWNDYTTPSVPMGHEVALSPLQLITAFCAFANDGVLLRPRVRRALLSSDGQVLQEFNGPQEVRRVMPVATARYFRDTVLAGVISHGGGNRAAVEGYEVFGKTGTAQIPYGVDKKTGKRKRKGYEPFAYMGSFVGGAPLENPRLAVLVMLYKPNAKIGYYGGVVSAPTVQQILQQSLAYLQIAPEVEGVAQAD